MSKRPPILPAIVAIVMAATSACTGVKTPVAHAGPRPPGVSLWDEPTDLASRDLYYGPWGQEHAPDPRATYTLVEYKHTGVNLGMTVKDKDGREWSVKQPYPGGLDPEGQVEVAVSRLLSAVGYHQPPVYFLPSFKLKDDFGTKRVAGGRFRLHEKTLKDLGAWKWEDNPFVASQPYQGLLVLLAMFNSTDLKNTNNTLYEKRDGDMVQHWYVTRDIGSALGDLHPWAPRKGNTDGFEHLPLIQGVSNGHVVFTYDGWYKNLYRDRITPNDVAWACELLGQLSDQQWNDAFRAGGYDRATAGRFIKKLKDKIEEGRGLGLRASR